MKPFATHSTIPLKRQLLIACLVIAGILVGVIIARPVDPPTPPVVAIATLDGVPILFDHYQLYLRENVHFFEQSMGEALWQADFAGMTATEFIKNQTLEFLAVVTWAIHHTQHPYTELTPTEQAQAHQEAQALWAELTAPEQDLFTFKTLYAVRRDVLLHNNIRDYLTQHYVAHQRNDVFLGMFADWRATVNLEVVTALWDRLDIQLFLQ